MTCDVVYNVTQAPKGATANLEADANAKNMEALAKAVSAIQASVDSFCEENHVSIASLQSTLSSYGQRITDVEDDLNEFERRLNNVELSQTSLAKENKALKEKKLH